MILDAKLQFADSQTLTADAVSTNVLDLGVARDVGAGKSLYVVVTVETAITGTLQVNLETDDNAAFSSATVSADLGSFVVTAPVGSVLKYKISPDVMNERYARLDFNDATGGVVSAHIVMDIDNVTNYGIGYTVS